MADRNQTARDREQAQRELGQQLQKFARLLNEGKTGMIDRFGIAITPGAYVLYRPTFDLIFEVVDVAPILDMSRPAGYLKLSLACETTIEFVAGQRGMSIVKCGERSKVEGEAAIQPPGSQPASEATAASVPPGAEDIRRPATYDGDPPLAQLDPPDEKLGGTD